MRSVTLPRHHLGYVFPVALGKPVSLLRPATERTGGLLIYYFEQSNHCTTISSAATLVAAVGRAVKPMRVRPISALFGTGPRLSPG